MPLFCATTRKGYGLAAQAMVRGSFTAPFECDTWPSPEGVGNFGFKKQFAGCKTEEEGRALAA